jgi:hypothetical protein
MKIGLVIPVLNNFDQAIDMIYSAKTDYELKIYIQPQYRFQVPLAAAWNAGIRQAITDKCDIIIVSNDDVLFSEKTITYLARETMAMPEDYVMAFPVDVCDGLIDPTQILWDDEVTGDETKNIEDQSFACFAIRSDFFDKCGTFDENFDPAWWEDTDMKYRIKLLGFRTFQTSIPYVHIRHQTTKKLTSPLNSLKSGQYYETKWGSARKDLKEAYRNPYNNPNINPKEWRLQ